MLDSDNRLTNDGTYEYVYNDEGARIRKGIMPEGDSEAFSGGDGSAYQTYTWDHRGRLTDIHSYDLGSQTQHVQYTYDALDRRVAKQVVLGEPSGSSGSSGSSCMDAPEMPACLPDSGALAERLIYDGSHLIAVADRDGAVVTQFLHGPMVDQVLAESHFDSLSGDRTDVSFIASDHLGSVRGLLSWSDSTSSVVSQSWLSYDAYGNELSTSTTDLGAVGHTVTRSRFGYTGRDRDSESDLQYNRARYYDAATGRWISQDPIGGHDGRRTSGWTPATRNVRRDSPKARRAWTIAA